MDELIAKRRSKVPSSVLETAFSMRETILASRNETETNRRVAKPIIDQLADARFCRFQLPKELGGHSATPVETLEVYEALAGFEASVPWIMWNNALICGLSRFFAREVREELFSNSSWIFAQSTRPTATAVPTDGGYRVSGRWSLVSGCELAEWLLLHCAIDSEQTRFFVVRKGDYTIHDTWRTGGLRGTGSHDVSVEDVFVPNEYSLMPTPQSPPSDDPIDRGPIITQSTVAFAAQALGVATASVNSLFDVARDSGASGAQPAMRGRSEVQLQVAQHATALDAARTHLHDCVDQIWQDTCAGVPARPEALGRAYAAAIHTDNAALNAVNAMYALGGTRVLYVENPLERAQRDLHAMLRHIVAQPDVLIDAGRVKLGLDPLNPLYMI